MRTKKILAVLVVISLLAAMIVQPVLAGGHGYMGGKSGETALTSSDSSHEAEESSSNDGGGPPGGKGQGGKGGAGGYEGGHEEHTDADENSNDSGAGSSDKETGNSGSGGNGHKGNGGPGGSESHHDDNSGTEDNAHDNEQGNQGGKDEGNDGGDEDGHKDVIDTDEEHDEEEGSQGKGEDNKGAVNKGGSGKGKGGSDNSKGKGGKGSIGQPANPGKITLTVKVIGLSPDITSVDVILIREEVETVETALMVNDVLTATFLSEASGDCIIKGTDVQGYETPSQDIRLTGDKKNIETTLEYEYIDEGITVIGVELDKTELNLIKGYSEPQQLSASIIPANASNQNVTWSTSDENVAKVDKGLVEAIGEGSCIITVTTEEGSYEDECSVKVLAIESLEVFEPREALKNEVVILPEKVTAIMSDESEMDLDVAWKDSGGTEVSVFQVPSNDPIGTLYVFAGTVRDTNVVAEYIIKAAEGPPAVPVAGITLNYNELSLQMNQEFQLEATLIHEQPANPDIRPTNTAVIWDSSNDNVASVDQNGLVKAEGIGYALISVTTVDGNYKAYCMVSVSPIPEIVYIYATGQNGEYVEHFTYPEQVYINVENLVEYFNIPSGTKYYVKVEQKGSDPVLGENDGQLEIGPGITEFNLYEETNFRLTDNYSKEYFVYMSTDGRYPKDNVRTVMTNFKVGSAVPTVPKENVKVTVEVIGGDRHNSPEGLIFLLCRELDLQELGYDSISQVSWRDYYDGANLPPNPYATGVSLDFVDEVKMTGEADEDGVVRWNEPREILKLGGYWLIEVTPNGYVDNLNLINTESDDGDLLKVVRLAREGVIERNVWNTYVGEDVPGATMLTMDESMGAFSTAAIDLVSCAGLNEEPFIREVEGFMHWSKESVLDLAYDKELSDLLNYSMGSIDEAITSEEICRMLEAKGIDTKSDMLSHKLSGDNVMTRQQVAAIMMIAFDFGNQENLTNLSFKDNSKINEDTKGYIAKAVELGILKGCPDNTFKPEKEISRAEFYTIISTTLRIIGV